MKTKLTDKQKAEVVKGARVAAARPQDDQFDAFWKEMTQEADRLHSARERSSIIRPRGRN